MDANGTLSTISVPTVIDDKTDVAYYKLNSNNELTTVVIEQKVSSAATLLNVTASVPAGQTGITSATEHAI